MIMKKLFILHLLLSVQFIVLSQNSPDTIFSSTDIFSGTKGTFIDSRDNKEYKWVKINNQIWMAQNLSAISYDNGEDISYVKEDSIWKEHDSHVKAWCYYDGNEDNLLKYGVLYNWPAVMNGEIKGDDKEKFVQGICPKGWHIPSYKEWNTLAKHLMSFHKTSYANNCGTYITEIGEDLKSTNYWMEDAKGSDRFGFNGMPGGERTFNGNFEYEGRKASWWSSTDVNGMRVWIYSVVGSSSDLRRNALSFQYAAYVRCVKDE